MCLFICLFVEIFADMKSPAGKAEFSLDQVSPVMTLSYIHSDAEVQSAPVSHPICEQISQFQREPRLPTTSSKHGCVGATAHEPDKYDTLVRRPTQGLWVVMIEMITHICPSDRFKTIEYVAKIGSITPPLSKHIFCQN